MHALGTIVGVAMALSLGYLSFRFFDRESWLYFVVTAVAGIGVAGLILPVPHRLQISLILMTLASLGASVWFVNKKMDKEAFFGCMSAIGFFILETANLSAAHESIACWGFAFGLLYAGFLLIKSGKLAESFIVLIISVVVFFWGTSAVQTLAKTGLLSKVGSSLQSYADRLDGFQANINSMRDELVVNQSNLNSQQKKLQTVELLVENLFSKTTYESIPFSDTNRVFFWHVPSNGWWKVYFILRHAPIPQSLQVAVRKADQGSSSGHGPWPVCTNVLTADLPSNWGRLLMT